MKVKKMLIKKEIEKTRKEYEEKSTMFKLVTSFYDYLLMISK